MKADIRLAIDELGLEAVVTLTHSAGGAELSAEAVVARCVSSGLPLREHFRKLTQSIARSR